MRLLLLLACVAIIAHGKPKRDNLLHTCILSYDQFLWVFFSICLYLLVNATGMESTHICRSHKVELSYDVAFGSEITPCDKIDKPP